MKIVVKAENREYPDNIGDYLWQSLKPAADSLDIDMIRLPTEEIYEKPGLVKKLALKEVAWINAQNPDLFIFFSNWVHGPSSRKIAQAYSALKCKSMFWSREDPNHFKPFLSDTDFVDIIGTCCSDCIPKYKAAARGKLKKVICLPMAVAPEIFYPGEGPASMELSSSSSPRINKIKYTDREWDIVFLGNRYRKREVRNDGEKAVVIAAAKWAVANGKKMGVWGLEKGAFGWHDCPEIMKTGIYQGGRCDRLQAADIYRNAKVALSIASNDYSPTMAPNRVVQIAATGTILIAYKSPATQWQTGGNANVVWGACDTRQCLNEIFDDPSYYIKRADRARLHVLAHHTFRHRLETILEALK